MGRGVTVAVLAVLLLGACAGERSFREGQQLLLDGQLEEGLVELEQASTQNPTNRKYRIALLNERVRAVNRFIALADRARAAGQFDAAEAQYRRALEIEPANVRAKKGLDVLQADRRHRILLVQVRELIRQGDYEEAQARLRPVLVQNPASREANDLQRRIDEEIVKGTTASPRLKAALRKPVTLEFRDANLRAVFEALFKTAGLNFVFDKDIPPQLTTTVFVKNTTVADALDLLLVTNQLAKKVLNEDTVLIYPNIPAKARTYQELVVKSFYLTNADVKETEKMIKTVVKTKDVFVNPILNQIVMRDTPEAVRLAEKLIAAQDLADPEVVLDVEVLEVSSNRLQELGIRYPTSLTASITGAGGEAGQLTYDEARNFNSGLLSLSVPDPTLVVNLQANDGFSNLLANPRIRVKNRQKAKIHIGDRLPVITTTSTANVGTSENITYQDVGLRLDVQPSVTLDDEVEISVALEVSNVVSEISTSNGTLAYRLGTRSALTQLRLKDGETQILAGLINDEQRNSADKIPGLGDLPIIGRLFSSRRDTAQKTEVVLLITPHVVRNVIRPEVRVAEFPSGTEASIGGSPLILRSAGVLGAPASALGGSGAAANPGAGVGGASPGIFSTPPSSGVFGGGQLPDPGAQPAPTPTPAPATTAPNAGAAPQAAPAQPATPDIGSDFVDPSPFNPSPYGASPGIGAPDPAPEAAPQPGQPATPQSPTPQPDAAAPPPVEYVPSETMQGGLPPTDGSFALPQDTYPQE